MHYVRATVEAVLLDGAHPYSLGEIADLGGTERLHVEGTLSFARCRKRV
jgi:hypothetical protein